MDNDWKKLDIPSNLKDSKLNTDLICLEECKNYSIKDGKFVFTNDVENNETNKVSKKDKLKKKSKKRKPKSTSNEKLPTDVENDDESEHKSEDETEDGSEEKMSKKQLMFKRRKENRTKRRRQANALQKLKRLPLNEENKKQIKSLEEMMNNKNDNGRCISMNNIVDCYAEHFDNSSDPVSEKTEGIITNENDKDTDQLKNVTKKTNKNNDNKNIDNKNNDNKNKDNKNKDNKNNEKKNNDKNTTKKVKLNKADKRLLEKKERESKFKSADTSAWKELSVSEPILRALSENGFSKPTPIQSKVLPLAINDKIDIVGAAETGSGKTLAFAIPMVCSILRRKQANINGEKESDYSDDSEYDLPPDSDDNVEFSDDLEDGSDEQEVGRCVRVRNNVDFSEMETLSPVCSSDSESDVEMTEDNDAVNKFSPHDPNSNLKALILAPTRELAVQVHDHISSICRHTDIRVVTVIGGMSQQKQERLLKRRPEIVVATPGRLWELVEMGNEHLSTITEIRHLVIDEADRMVEKGHFEEMTKLLNFINEDEKKLARRQTMVFSATLTLSHSGPNRVFKKKKTFSTEEKLEQLITHIGVKSNRKVIDLTLKSGTAETLVEAKINCPTLEDKDLYVYYLMHQYPGRTILFANSKDCVRRLVSLFTLLNLSPLPLHADMQQRQRLRNLDRFKDNKHGLLLTTDVAARGLDIPDVEHVLHYQTSRTTENYVHRSGRTARACKEGLSILLIGSDDLKNYQKIIMNLNKGEDLATFPIEVDIVNAMKNRLALARTIDKEEHKLSRQKKQNNWFENAAKEVDMKLDEDELLHDMGDDFEQNMQKKRIVALKNEMIDMLRSPLLSPKFKGKFITENSRKTIKANYDNLSAIDTLKPEEKKNNEKPSSIKRKRKNRLFRLKNKQMKTNDE